MSFQSQTDFFVWF